MMITMGQSLNKSSCAPSRIPACVAVFVCIAAVGHGCGCDRAIIVVHDAAADNQVSADSPDEEFIAGEPETDDRLEPLPDDLDPDETGETPAVTWAKSYGGEEREWACAIQQTFDDGYILVGWTNSFGTGGIDALVIKLDEQGNVAWQRTYGGPEEDRPMHVRQAPDGGYIVAGRTSSFGAGEADAWVLRLDESGSIIWQNTYGGESDDWARHILPTFDDGYIITGGTGSFGEGDKDFLVFKLDDSGNVMWQRTYGSERSEYASSMQQASEGGYYLAGWTEISSGRYWADVLFLDSDGEIVWRHTIDEFTGGGDSLPIEPLPGGGFIFASNAGADFWVAKLDERLNSYYNRTYGGEGNEYPNAIRRTADGGYVVAGWTNSFAARENDIWILKIASNLDIEWQKTYGGEASDNVLSIQQTSDGGYVVAGVTESFGRGDIDIWVLFPELITSDAAMQATIREHPGLKWKALNVRKHFGLPLEEEI